MPLPTSIVATGLAAILFGVGWGMTGYCPGTCWAAAGEGRGCVIFALLGGFVGTAVFAAFHETLIPRLYLPTNIGQLTLDGLFNSAAAGLVLLVVVFAGGVVMIGRLWQKNESID